MKPSNLPLFAKITAKLPTDSGAALGSNVDSAFNSWVKNKMVGAIPKLLKPPSKVGKLDFAAAVDRAEIPSAQFVGSFVLRKVAS